MTAHIIGAHPFVAASALNNQRAEEEVKDARGYENDAQGGIESIEEVMNREEEPNTFHDRPSAFVLNGSPDPGKRHYIPLTVSVRWEWNGDLLLL